MTVPAPVASAAVVGGGPAGLMAAEVLLAGGLAVDLYEAAPSVGRKILIAGKGGLNLTHSEAPARFVTRYRERSAEAARWLADFDAAELRRWAAGLGIATLVGSSGRVFPSDYKAAPLLRAWLRRLRAQGLRIHTRHRFVGWSEAGALRIEDLAHADVLESSPRLTLLALGGASWSKLGADGRWVQMLRDSGVEVSDLAPSNCGFECDWSPHLRQRWAGAPVKPVALKLPDTDWLRGEFVLTEHGVEGSLIYACSAAIRQRIERDGVAQLQLDLCPGQAAAELAQRLQAARGGRSWSEFLRRRIGLSGARMALLRELAPAAAWQSVDALLPWLKSLPLSLQRTRPIDEAISCAGGVRFQSLDAGGQLLARPGVWCAGEMIDWEAPTGGYLINACLASGRAAALAALASLQPETLKRLPGGAAVAPQACSIEERRDGRAE